jgi:perosamine synthetase
VRRILTAKPSIAQREIDYAADAVANGWGEDCYGYLTRFTEALQSYFGVEQAWPTSSCHGALHMVLMALGVGPGDEVIVPDATWTGSVFPITWLGATPVFADVLPDTWCIDPQAVERLITGKTKAIVPVHLYGNLCEMASLVAIGKAHDIPVIEDAAEAIGSEIDGRKAGAIADFGVFSFHGTKTLTTGEGGAILSNRRDLDDAIRAIDAQGRVPGAERFWVDRVGLKYKMSNVQAAIGLAQFERADELVASKRRVFQWYREALIDLSDVTMNPEPPGTLNSYWQPTVIFGQSYGMTVDKRNRLMQRCIDLGVEVRPFFYPVSSLPMYSDVPSNTVARRLSASGLNLPSYHELSRDDIFFVVDTLKQSLAEMT